MFNQTLEEIAAAKERGEPLAGVGENCYIENAILDKNCAIGDNVRIIGGSHLEDGDGGIVVKKGAVLSPGTAIGVEKA